MQLKPVVWIPLVLVVALALILLFLLPKRMQGEPAATGKQLQPPLVDVLVVQPTAISQALEVTGEVVPVASAVISTLKEGRIDFLPWREGDAVQAGEILVTVDQHILEGEKLAAQASLHLAQAKLTDLRAGARPEDIRKAESVLASAEATRNEAQQSYQRQLELYDAGVIAQDALDKAHERLKVAQAAVASAQESLKALEAGPTSTAIAVQEAAVNEAGARLALAEAHLAENTVKAPFDGLIAAVYAHAGDIAIPNKPLLEMYDPDSLVIKFTVSESEFQTVQLGMALDVILDALPGEKLAAQVSRTYPQLDPTLRSRTVEATVESDGDMLAPNMFARLQLHTAHVENALVIPKSALVTTDAGTSVYVVAEGKAALRSVTTGIETGTQVQLLTGVSAGEAVVVAGREVLKPGQPVRIASDKPKDKADEDGAKQQDQPAKPGNGSKQ